MQGGSPLKLPKVIHPSLQTPLLPGKSPKSPRRSPRKLLTCTYWFFMMYLLLKKYHETNSIADQMRAPRRRQLSIERFQFIDEAMEADRELTSQQFHGRVVEKYPDLNVLISSIKRACRALGWNSKKTRYCALISEINEEKR